ncbi:MAG: hypothetical protein ABR578_04870 [Chromatocurvus sp.]
MLLSDDHVFASLALDGRDRQAFDSLLDTLAARHRGAVLGVLVYGSCLRSGDIFDGLVDIYLLCSGYRAAYRRYAQAVGNRLLPPNVYYAAHRSGERVLRSKVSVMSLADFEHACSARRFESYFWGRFAQPVALARVRDEPTRTAIAAALQNASTTLLRRSLPVLPRQGSITDLWVEALQLSYATELRTERPGRTRELVLAAETFYRAAVTRTVREGYTPLLALDFSVSPPAYRHSASAAHRRRGRIAWALRRGIGKLLSIARLVKALFTFEGGLDYIAWKLERHSGERIEIPPRVRRRPLLYGWGFFWRLYRRGIFK